MINYEGLPQDRFNFVYFTHLLLGCSVFLLWKTFITPYDYFAYLYPDFHFEFWFASFYWTPAVPILLLMMWKGHKLPLKGRIIVSLFVYLSIVIAVPLIDTYLWKSNRDVALWITLVLVLIGGSFSAVFFASSFGLASMFPSVYTQAILTGNAIAGLATVTLRILTKSFLNSDSDRSLSINLYFGLSSFIIFSTLVCYLIMNKTKYAEYHYNRTMSDNIPSEGSGELLIQGENKKVSIRTVLIEREIWKPALLVLVTFTTTASLWPGLVTSMKPEHGNQLEGWFEIILISIFCVGDFIGRFLSNPKTHIISMQYVWIPIVLRLAFFPLVILHVRPNLLQYDWISYLITFLIPLTGGYFGGICMVQGPGSVKSNERELAATIMTSSLNGGIFLGSNLALLLLWSVVGDVWGGGG